MSTTDKRHGEVDRRWHDLGDFIREQRRVTHLSLRKLSRMAGISNPYLSQIERGMRRPSAEILQQIARALQISSETLYVQAGILDDRPRSQPTDVVAAVRDDPHLSDDQMRTLLRLYWSLRRENDERRGPQEGSRARQERQRSDRRAVQSGERRGQGKESPGT